MQELPPFPQLLHALADFATAVAQHLSGGDVDWRWQPDATEWSLTAVMCHLRDVEREVHQVRFRALLEKDSPFLSGVITDEWSESRHYARQDGAEARDAFLAARRKTLALLHALDEAEWQRQGTHAFLGPTTLHELVYLVVKHDEAHWQQIEKLLGQRAAPKPRPEPKGH